jgi:glutamyl-tRNA synthetase
MSMTVVTRFPPSPTGALHLGGARTALFNFLFARHHDGRFILRLEDTDRERSTEESAQEIVEALTWLGLSWDNRKLHRQSQRIDLYRKYRDRLLDSGRAYWCHCSPEILKEKREAALAQGKKPMYDGTCRDLGLGPAPGAAVRLKSPRAGATHFHDLIKGPISFDNAELDDLILWRSDDTPTYHLAVVVDDVTMDVTHVIRGDDHVNNTPRQMLILEALDEPMPAYAHVPMILGPDGARLSKRHGATSVLAYRDLGYLSQAMVNYLARLGWAHGDEEIFSLGDLIDKFTLEGVGKAAAKFNPDKLLWLNQQWIMKLPNCAAKQDMEVSDPSVTLVEPADGAGLTAWPREGQDTSVSGALIDFKRATGRTENWNDRPDSIYLMSAIEGLRTRSKTLVEMDDGLTFYYLPDDRIEYDPKAAKKFLKPDVSAVFEDLTKRLEQAPDFEEKTLEVIFNDLAQTRSLKLGQVAQPVRVALTGTTVSPGIFEVMRVLGRDRVLTRLGRAMIHIAAKGLDNDPATA